MGNIIGNAFSTYVFNQINGRQKVLSFQNRNDNHLTWMNSKTAWMRLASSVNVDKTITDKVFGANSGLNGDALAKKCVLFGGITDTTNTIPSMNHGIYYAQPPSTSDYNPLINPGAYGFGGLSLGYSPMPGLEGANVTFYNRGSLAKASIQIKCFNVQQLQILDMLYMKLGYTILLEWGWSKYIDTQNKNNPLDITSFPKFKTTSFNHFFDSTNNQYDITENIQRDRLKYAGNYDGFYGKISNFNWTFNPDGTYSINLTAISIGDIIESLKINTSLPQNHQLLDLPKSENDSDEDTTSTKNDPGKSKTAINTWISKIKATLNEQINNKNSKGDIMNSANFDIKLETDKEKIEAGGKDKTVRSYSVMSEFGTKKFTGIESITRAGVALLYKQGEAQKEISRNTQYYVKLGYFLKFIQNNMLVYDTEHDGVPYVGIDYNFDSNYCLTFPQQVSTDPSICVIPMRNNAGNHFGNWNYLVGRGNHSPLGFDFNILNKPFVGRLMHIHVNTDFIESTLNNIPIDQKGKISLYDFLSNIMLGIQEALGSVNRFTITFNKETLKYVILDDNNLGYSKQGMLQRTKFSKFNVFGVKPLDNSKDITIGTKDSNKSSPSSLGGSFIHNVGFNVTVNNKLAMMITTGAQANGNVVGENATGLSKLNQGFKDRIITTKLDSSYLGKQDYSGLIEYTTMTEKEKEEFEKKSEVEKTAWVTAIKDEKKFRKNVERISFLLGKLYWFPGMDAIRTVEYEEDEDQDQKDWNWKDDNPEINKEMISALKSIFRDFALYVLGYYSNKNVIPSPFFLPFHLKLDMEGLSGMRIYEKFTITNDILPDTYRTENDGKSKVDFLIKGVTHDLKGDKWTTTLDTLSIPSDSLINPKIDKPSSKVPLFEDKGVTYPTGLPVKDIFYKESFPIKTQIYLHHTAGHPQTWKNDLTDWNNRTDHVSTMYIIDETGHREMIFDPDNWSNHLGISEASDYVQELSKKTGEHISGKRLHKNSYSVELCSYGWLTKKNSKYYAVGGTKEIKHPNTNVGQPVSDDGKILKDGYRGYKYFYKYTPKQIESLKKLIQELQVLPTKDGRGGEKIPFNYSYSDMFPGEDRVSKDALTGIPGVYTHNSVIPKGKWDLWPQKELIEMFKSISDTKEKEITIKHQERAIMLYNAMVGGTDKQLFWEALTTDKKYVPDNPTKGILPDYDLRAIERYFNRELPLIVENGEYKYSAFGETYINYEDFYELNYTTYETTPKTERDLGRPASKYYPETLYSWVDGEGDNLLNQVKKYFGWKTEEVENRKQLDYFWKKKRWNK